MVSEPGSLPFLDLEVKISRHPPAEWVTRTAKVGDRVIVKVGGNYTYRLPSTQQDNDARSNSKLLLVAGGVGINPLYSILQHVLLSLSEQGDRNVSGLKDRDPDQRVGMNTEISPKIVLLYTARSADELAFRPELEKLAQRFPTQLRVVFTVTAKEESAVSTTTKIINITRGSAVADIADGSCGWVMNHQRLSEELLKSSAEWLHHLPSSSSSPHAFPSDGIDVLVCGPPGMPEDIKRKCVHYVGLKPEKVRFEKWW